MIVESLLSTPYSLLPTTLAFSVNLFAMANLMNYYRLLILKNIVQHPIITYTKLVEHG